MLGCRYSHVRHQQEVFQIYRAAEIGLLVVTFCLGLSYFWYYPGEVIVIALALAIAGVLTEGFTRKRVNLKYIFVLVTGAAIVLAFIRLM